MPDNLTSGAQAVNRPRAVEFDLVNPPADTTTEPDTGIDIIAIHGLDTKSPETWVYRQPDGQHVNWLADSEMLPKEVPGTRIYTCNWPAAMFETHDSVPFGIEELATSFLHGLLGLISKEDRKLFFIASCLGGVILMKTLIMAKTGYMAIQDATRGIIFLATPFRGTSFADIAAWAQPGLSTVASIRNQRLSGLLDWVKSSDSKLVHLVGEFTRFYMEHRNQDLKVATFYEKRYTNLTSKVPGLWWVLPYNGKLLVDMDSATLDCVPMRIPLDRTHVLMNKFCAQEPDYKQVIGIIRRFLDVIRTGTLLEQADAWIRDKCYTPDRLKVERLSKGLVDMDQSYINLAIVTQAERGTSGRDQKDSSSPFTLLARQKLEMPAGDDNVILKNLFDKRERSDGTEFLPRKILIRGRAGIGKTTLCKKVIHDFKKREIWNDIFDRVLWIPLRNLKQRTGSWYDLRTLFDQEFFQSSDNDRIDGSTQFAKEIRKVLAHNRTLFILDGWDEVVSVSDAGDISALLLNLLDQPNVIITSRPSASLPPSIKVDLELETIGFNEAQVDEYIEKVHQKNVSELKQFLKCHELVRGLVRIPIQLDAFCYCWDDIKSDNSRNPETMTTLYQAIQTSLWKKDADRLEKAKAKSLHTASQRFVEKKVEAELEFLEYLAFTGLATDRIEFNVNDRNHVNEDSGLFLSLDETLPCLSFLRTSDQSVKSEYQHYHFIHLTFQEYFAARYLVRHWIKDVDMKYTVLGINDTIVGKGRVKTIHPREFLKQNKYDAGFNIMWRFVSGLSAENGLDQDLFHAIEQEPLDLLGPSHQRLVMHCLSEVPVYQTDPQPYRARLEKCLSNWLLFECHFRNTASLADETEFPDASLRYALQQGQTESKLTILGSIRRRTLSQEMIRVIMSLIGEDSTLSSHALKALDKVSTLQAEALHTIIGLLQDNKYYSGYSFVITMGQSNLHDEDNDIIAKCLVKYITHGRGYFIFPRFHPVVVSRRLAKAIVKRLMSSEDPGQLIKGMRTQGRIIHYILEEIGKQLGGQHSVWKMTALKSLRRHEGQFPKNTIKAVTDEVENSRESHIQIAALEVLRVYSRRYPLPTRSIEVITKTIEKWTDLNVRKTALELFQNHSSLPQYSKDVLVKQLQDPDYSIQQATFRALAGQSELCQSEIDAIIEHLNRQESDKQGAKFKSLEDTPLRFPRLVTAIAEHFHYSEAVLEILSYQETLPKAMIEAITARLEIPDPRTQIAALYTLRYQEDLPEATTESMKAFLRNPDLELRKAALLALPEKSELPHATAKSIVEFLSDSDSYVRSTALSVLGDQSVLPKETVYEIAKCLHDPDIDVREGAKWALKAHPPLPDAIEEIIFHSSMRYHDLYSMNIVVIGKSILPKVLIDSIIRRIEDTGESSHQAIRSVLYHKTGLPEITAQIISQRLDAAQTDISQASIMALVSQPTLPKAVINSVAEELRNPDEDIRRQILKVLRYQQDLSHNSIWAVMEQLKNVKPFLQHNALGVLKVQLKLLPETIEAITELLDNPDTDLQKAALEAFHYLRRPALPRETIEAVTERLKNPDETIWASALKILENQLVLPQEAIVALISQFENTEGDAQKEVCGVLNQLPVFVETAINKFASGMDDNKGTATHLGSPTRQPDQTLRHLCEIMIRRGFEESLSLYIHDNAVWVDDRSGRRTFKFDGNLAMVDSVRRSIETFRPDGYPAETVWVSTEEGH